jgi:sulfur-carrier protein adenylyltransferase/sulfurtransferase
MSQRSVNDVLAGARETVAESSPAELDSQLGRRLVIDVRERDEWDEGYIPSAHHISRGFLELRIENLAPDRSTPITLYCAGGVRSLLAAKNLQELGYADVESLWGGFRAWKSDGLQIEHPDALSDSQQQRYSRHLLIPEVGDAGQAKLLQSKVLILGAGGLGCPAALYLAAAGVGTIGLIDPDVVEVSNLQRQVLHTTDRVGRRKTESARQTLNALNPDVTVVEHTLALTSHNAREIFDGYDLIINGCDNFATRYLANDVAVFTGKPLVDGSILRFEGSVTTIIPGSSPCYRCRYPEPPPPGEVPSCSDAGVLGVVPGIVGTLQAAEALKVLLGIGQPLTGRVLHIDTLDAAWREFEVRRDPSCPVCGEHPTITEPIDYDAFCGLPQVSSNQPRIKVTA